MRPEDRSVSRPLKIYPGYRAVPGWLYGPSVTRPEDAFMAHSVAEHPGAATLIDVAPFPGQSRLVRLNFRFFRHLGSVALYRSLKALYVDVSRIQGPGRRGRYGTASITPNRAERHWASPRTEGSSRYRSVTARTVD
jgi:hypothetical protein